MIEIKKREKQKHKPQSKSRVKSITLGFMGLIAVGTFLLMMPFSKAGEGGSDLLTALFTATSATCVTGLTVVDTATYWTFGGQLVILMLIQIGGLGVMMLGAMVALAAKRKITIGQRMLLSTSLNLDDISGIVRLAKMIIWGTFIIEGLGAAGLTACLAKDFGFWGALEKGIFISISAFCNAGFDNLGVGGEFASMIPYKDNAPILLILAALIAIGGIGFYVWNDIIMFVRRKKRISFHTKLVLSTTDVLIFGGAACFLVTELHGTAMRGESFPLKAVQAVFQAVTARTAGFDHLGQGELTSASKALTDILMFIGGSPGSVAGGIKTTTIAVVILASLNSFYDRKYVTVFGRTIPEKTITQAMSLFFLFGTTTLTGALVISVIEGISFEATLFECISAMATVGLSTGITPSLSSLSKIFLVVLMFLGRVGIITVGMTALMRSYPDDSIKLPEGKVIIG